MKVSRNGTIVTIPMDSQLEVDILASSLNWAVSAMAKSNMIDVSKGCDLTQEKVRLQRAVWVEFCKVNPYHGGDYALAVRLDKEVKE